MLVIKCGGFRTQTLTLEVRSVYNYDNRGLVLALCQLDRYKQRKDVSHVSGAEERFTMHVLRV